MRGDFILGCSMRARESVVMIEIQVRSSSLGEWVSSGQGRVKRSEWSGVSGGVSGWEEEVSRMEMSSVLDVFDGDGVGLWEVFRVKSIWVSWGRLLVLPFFLDGLGVRVGFFDCPVMAHP